MMFCLSVRGEGKYCISRRYVDKITVKLRIEEIYILGIGEAFATVKSRYAKFTGSNHLQALRIPLISSTRTAFSQMVGEYYYNLYNKTKIKSLWIEFNFLPCSLKWLNTYTLQKYINHFLHPYSIWVKW